MVLDLIDEKDWQAEVVETARRHGWWTYHTYDSRHSTAGWVDLTMIRPPRTVFAELKSEHGRIRPAQREVRELLQQCPGVEVYLWRPRDRGLMEDVLS